MIYSSFKSENLVIMQVLTASSFWPTCQCTVHCKYILCITFYVMKPRILFHFYSALMFLLESMKTSSMVEKSLNKSFKLHIHFWGAPNIRPQMMLFTLNLSPEISTLTLKDSYPWNLFMERRNTCLMIRKLLVLVTCCSCKCYELTPFL